MGKTNPKIFFGGKPNFGAGIYGMLVKLEKV